MPDDGPQTRRQTLQLLERRRLVQVLAHHLGERTAEGHLPGEHIPQRHPQRVDVRANIDLLFLELLRAGKVRGADKSPHREGGEVVVLFVLDRFGEAKIDHLDEKIVVLPDEHQVGRLNVAMDEMVLLRRRERARHLQRDAHRDHRIDRSLALDEGLDRLAIDKFHRVKKRVAVRAEMKDRSDIGMAQLGRGPRLAHEALLRDFALEIFRVDHLERDVDPQIGIERLVGDAHRAPAELEGRAILAGQHFVVIERHFGNGAAFKR